MDDKEMSMREALNLALDQAMAADDRVFLLGEDIADPGASGPTAGLSTKYGHDRVLDTPISEAAIVGAAIGAAIDGLLPVAEIMIMDFIGIAADQLINNAAKLRFMTAGRTTAPITVRTQVYGGLATGATHSQTLEAWFMHIPGMKVIVPSTPRDGKGLLTSAIFDEDPCLFVETIRLQGQKGLVPTDPGFSIPLGQADIKRPGSDVTLISYGRSVLESLAAAKALAGAGCQRRGRRPTHARAARRRHHRRVGAPHPARGGRARRGPIRRPGSGNRRDPAGRVFRRARRARSSGWRRGSSRHPPRRRSKRRSTRRRRASSRPRSGRSRRRVPVADFVIRIPRVSVAVSEAELTELLVGAGEHVEEGTPIYVIATEKVEQEIEAGASGTVQWTGTDRDHLRHRRRNRRHHVITNRKRRTMDLNETRERIIYEKEGPIAKITLNWPEKANAQDQKLAEEVDAALLDADRDYDIKVLVLKANGKGFCSGHAIGNNAVDYPAFVEGAMVTGHPWKPQSDLFVKPTLNLWEFSKPTIAQVHGYCVGGGTHMGLTTDIVIASEDAYFSYPPLQGFGMPSGECSIEPWVFMNWRRAAYYLYTAEVDRRRRRRSSTAWSTRWSSVRTSMRVSTRSPATSRRLR